MNVLKRKKKKEQHGDFHRQVRLAAVQAAGLSTAELETALAYELEPESGIPATEAEVEFAFVDDPDITVRVYDVTVRRKKTSTGDDTAKWLPISKIFAIAVFAVIGTDFALNTMRLDSVKKEMSVRGPLDAKIKTVKRTAQNLRDEAAAIRESRGNAEKAQTAVAEHRGSWRNFLAALADACGANAVVRNISSPEPFSAEISATAISAQAAADAMAAITLKAGKVNWICEPGDISERDRGGTVDFSCRLTYGGVR